MGYTHYWSNAAEFRPEAWAALQETARKIIDKMNAQKPGVVIVQYEYDDDKPALVNDICIRFNGVEDDGHETFLLNRFHEDFAFCKTACKPYDDAVVAVLIAAAEYSTGFDWRSDGDPDEHAAGLALYNEVTGNQLGASNVNTRD